MAAPEAGDLPFKGNTLIGNDVWIAYDSQITLGVKIGDVTIISSRFVVTRDVAAYTVVGGNQAQSIKQRFDADVVAQRLDIAWRHWPVQKIIANI